MTVDEPRQPPHDRRRRRHRGRTPPARAGSAMLGGLVMLTVLALVACGNAADGPDSPIADARPVHVLAAASLTNVLEALQPDLEAAAGRPVVLVFAASSTLARQVAAGAACELYLSADTAWVDELDDRGFVAERRPLPANAMVVIAPRPRDAAATPSSAAPVRSDPVAFLRSPAVRRIAVADPDAVPAGRHARRALAHAGAWNDLGPRLVIAANVRQALAWVESGDADAGIVYATDAAISSRVQPIGSLSPDPAHPVRGAAALTPSGARIAAARRVWKALETPAAHAAFARFGFATNAVRSPTSAPSSAPALAPGDGQ